MTNHFREVDRELCLVQSLAAIHMLDPQGQSRANAVLCCGYIDHTAGLTFEVLSLVSCVGNDYTILPEYEKMGVKLRASSVKPDSVVPIQNEALKARYAFRIKILDSYYKDKDITTCRTYQEFDSFRHPHFPDDICASFMWPDQKVERMWVRTKRLYKEENNVLFFLGTLMNEPHHGTHLHYGNQVMFATFVNEGSRLCVGAVPDEP